MSLNWPSVVLILGVIALVLFRAPLSRLLERTEKVKDWLVAPKQPAIPATGDQTLPTRDTQAEQKALEALTEGFNSQLLLLQEEAIRSDLTKHGLAAENATEKVLLRHLAGTQIALHFEKVYAVIFRSQLQALRWLNAQSDGVSGASLRPFYDQAVAAWPSMYATRDFGAWLGFLALHGLITESAESASTPDDEQPFGLQVTVLGREFLGFLVSSGRADPVVG